MILAESMRTEVSVISGTDLVEEVFEDGTGSGDGHPERTRDSNDSTITTACLIINLLPHLLPDFTMINEHKSN
jgi:hypothetical protein